MRRAWILAAFSMVLVVAPGCQTQHVGGGAESVVTAGQQSMVVELPTPRPVGAQQSFSCRALMESDVTGSYDATLTKGLEG